MSQHHVRKCSVPGCTEKGENFHSLPKDPRTRQAWIIFLICSKYFTKDRFQNLGQFKAGFAKLFLFFYLKYKLYKYIFLFTILV
uniref:THAP-type domain-containing protein n=1 Tax=Cyprinodon variegatus TaxID=28743 RepID=A0A3Q2GFR3_CYPVA